MSSSTCSREGKHMQEATSKAKSGSWTIGPTKNIGENWINIGKKLGKLDMLKNN